MFISLNFVVLNCLAFDVIMMPILLLNNFAHHSYTAIYLKLDQNK